MDRLPDKLESNGRVEVRVNGTVIGTRRIIDFVSSGGNVDDGGTDDKVSVDTSGFGGGASTNYWTFNGVTGFLGPDPAVVTPFTEFTVQTDDGSDIDLDGVSGDLNIGLNEDFNLQAARDVNMSAGVGAGAGDVNIDASTGTGPSSGNVNIRAGLIVSFNSDKIHFHGKAVATGPVGTIIGKVPIHDSSGTLIGYFPVYDTIT